ncbi:MAG: hypothetical protein GWO38_18195 [Phycisphaerae bacterium]|nr:hypothetical protein [Phycisphaerae bacterium]NIW43878.1 hypothetical protein [Gammaproteobacteria bacterium]NIX29505.1 hypothetical protein [Phycisphaerae bacterium]
MLSVIDFINWLSKIAVIWIGIDILIVATIWYAVTVIKPYWPTWWRRIVIDERMAFDD